MAEQTGLNVADNQREFRLKETGGNCPWQTRALRAQYHTAPSAYRKISVQTPGGDQSQGGHSVLPTGRSHLQIKERIFQTRHMALIKLTLDHPGYYFEKFHFDRDMALFYFCLSGEEKSTFSGASREMYIKKGRCGMFMGSQGIQGEAHIPGRQPFQTLSIRIPVEELNQIAGTDRADQRVPSEYQRLTKDRPAGWFNRDLPMPPMIRVAVGQMFGCPLTGGFKDLYLEGKSLEILAWVLDRIRHPRENSPAFCAGDIKRLERARERLIADLARPPGLMELAKFAGMHHTKLNQGFKFIYGKTVFAYLSQARLETARRMLESGEMNCTEAGLFVGYANPSHFSRAFKAQYQASPNAFRKKAIQVPDSPLLPARP